MATLEAGFQYLTRNKLYIWRKKKNEMPVTDDIALGEDRDDPAKYVPAATGSKIKDLAWSLDVHERPLGGPESDNRTL